MVDLLGPIAGGLLGGALVQLVRQRRRSTRLRQGRSLVVPCFLRGSAAPYPRRWRQGHLDLGSTVDWFAHLSLRRPRTPIPTPAAVDVVRDVQGSEGWSVNFACRVIVCRHGEETFELAVLPGDLQAVREALLMSAHS